MNITASKTGKKLKITKSEWVAIGLKAGWMKTAAAVISGQNEELVLGDMVTGNVWPGDTMGDIVAVVAKDHVVVRDRGDGKEYDWDPKHLRKLNCPSYTEAEKLKVGDKVILTNGFEYKVTDYNSNGRIRTWRGERTTSMGQPSSYWFNIFEIRRIIPNTPPST